MSRIIFVPQYPTQNRYQEWWLRKFSEEFIKAGFNVHVLGATKAYEMKMTRGNLSMFSPIHASIEFECAQIDEYMNMDIQDDDILFVADISFPGFFCNALFHKRTDKMFAFCHATSLNYKDYFEKVRNVKYPVETSHAAMFDKVFVGSKYHQDKLGWHNTVVTYLPFPPFLPQKNIKKYEIISASRPTPQKVDLQLEKEVEATFSKIVRKDTRSWTEYFKFLSESTVLLITSHEDTFGYQIVDAIMNGCIPIAPNRCAYPELLPKEYLYNDDEELFKIIDDALWGLLDVPKLKCKDGMNNFYNKIISEIMTEVDYPF
jgi:hypothetical protein